jgi:hypothetical protein
MNLEQLIKDLSHLDTASKSISHLTSQYFSTHDPSLLALSLTLFKMRFRGEYSHPLLIISAMKMVNQMFLTGAEECVKGVLEVALGHVVEFAGLYRLV